MMTRIVSDDFDKSDDLILKKKIRTIHDKYNMQQMSKIQKLRICWFVL